MQESFSQAISQRLGVDTPSAGNVDSVRRRWRGVAAAALLIFLPAGHAGTGPVGEEQAELTIHFSNRPPLVESEKSPNGDGRIGGPLYDKAQLVLARAGVHARFIEMPLKRRDQETLQYGNPACSIGVYKTKEREALFVFSQAIFLDLPWVVVSRPEVTGAVRQFHTLNDFTQKTDLRALFAGGLSLGNQIDGMIAKLRGHVERPSVPAGQVLRMLTQNRGDFTLLPQDLFEAFRTENPTSPLDATVFADVVGQASYLMCNKAMSPRLLGRIDAAIAASGGAGRLLPK
ncbi:type 2 periplasmic-binding domain-containing protein [Roseateles koreensis]|uniref:Solute-binding protein family 3/N-terminal domain-containing protein n=1 Tax=Roseateles koreensis TaxID=2987526 RepID=A0ABT5KNK2_9BURK|nr:hypothetical protein [Roseateles koreensis]MDC8784503.1 hypothetical protein [Roseateles koreensis]